MQKLSLLDIIEIIKYLKVFQHVLDHRGSISRKPCDAKHVPGILNIS
jgi:hypothetical protein